jgi:hypothetical protein
VYGTSTKGGCDSFVVPNNLIYDAPTGEAIQIGDSARNGFIVNNTIDNTDTRSTSGTSVCTDYSSQAMVVWGGGNYPTANTLITNNIISNNCGPGVNASTSGSLVGNVVRNNFGYHNAYACNWCKSGVDYDPIYGSYVGFTVGTNLPDADPLYVNRTGTWSSAGKNFHLQAGSPALGKSDPAYTPPLDKDGKARPSTPALGAYG